MMKAMALLCSAILLLGLSGTASATRGVGGARMPLQMGIYGINEQNPIATQQPISNRVCSGTFASDCAKIYACSPGGTGDFSIARVWDTQPVVRTERACLDCSMDFVDTFDVSYVEGDWPLNCDQVCGGPNRNSPDFTTHVQQIAQNCPFSINPAVAAANLAGIAPGTEAGGLAAAAPSGAAAVAPAPEPAAETPPSTFGASTVVQPQPVQAVPQGPIG